MDERRFDEDEVAEILDQATSSEPSPSAGTSLTPATSGLTLTELQEIGSEVGIDPERIATAARAVATRSITTVAKPRTFLGAPRSVARTVPIDGPLSDEEWARVIAEVRQTFGAQGTIESHGALRSWSNGNLQVHVEPDADGYRLRMQTFKGNAAPLTAMGAGFVGMGAIGMVSTVMGAFEVAPMLFAGLLAAAGLTQVIAVRTSLPRWAAEREAQMDALAGRIPLLLDSGDD